MKATAVTTIFILFLASRTVHGFDFSGLLDTAKEVLGIVMNCAQENQCGFTQVLTAATNPSSNFKCTLACVMDNFMLVNDNGEVNVELLESIPQMVQLPARITAATDVILTNCKTAGQGSDKCNNCYNFIMCGAKNVFKAGMAMIRGGGGGGGGGSARSRNG